jgi:hypothetical protein
VIRFPRESGEEDEDAQADPRSQIERHGAGAT